MKLISKNIIALALLISLTIASGNLFAERYDNNGSISTNFENRGNNEIVMEFKNNDISLNQEKNFITRFVAIEADEIEVNIDEITLAAIDLASEEFLNVRTISGEKANEIKETFDFQISDQIIMRELVGFNLIIPTSNNNSFDNTVDIVKNMKLNIKTKKSLSQKKRATNKISPAFKNAYETLADNFGSSYLGSREVANSGMLIIAKSSLETSLQILIDWKKAMGINATFVSQESIGTTNTEVKNYIQNLYDNSSEENPFPDYLLLIGDVDDIYEFPSYYHGPDNNVTDFPYSMLEGDDYFPEMLIGRFSVDTEAELMTMIKKVLFYEKTPYMGNTDWFKKALMVAGNYASTPPTPTTPVKVSKWLKDKMLNYGYDEVEELYYWPPNYTVYPGTDEITSAINSGVGFVSYRGWGDAHGWHYPHYHTGDIDDLNNGFYTPVVTSIVCNTGDFANTDVDPCFGEKITRIGSSTTPKGAVAVVGPSDLHTSTKFNNSIFSGFYYGLLNERVFGFSSAVLRGKIELYQNFPNNHGAGGLVEFYFYVYNLLGDPSLSMWTKVPQNIGADIPSEITLGTNYIEITVSNSLNNGTATAIKTDDNLYSIAKVKDGKAILYIDDFTTGDIEVTITKPNYKPQIEQVTVSSSSSADLGISNVDYVTGVNPGSNVTLDLTLKNSGSATANSVSADLTCSSEYVNITTTSQDYGDISAGATENKEFIFALSEDCRSGEILEFSLEMSNGDISKFEIIVDTYSLEVLSVTIDDSNGILEPGEDREIILEIRNNGSNNIVGLNGTIITRTDATTVTNSTSSIGNISSGSTGNATFQVSVEPDCAIGKNAIFELILRDENNLGSEQLFSIIIGDVDNTAPTGPDTFGYYAYDSFDTDYSEAPTYEWVEIDPDQGGSGTVLLLGDDRSVTIPMPMNFKFYNYTPDSLTLNTNGWISVIPTTSTNFRNWRIPASLGAYGMIAPYWDDLIGELVGEDHEDMRICYWNDTANNRFIVEWNATYNNFNDTSLEKFQIILLDPSHYPTADGNGEIIFNYHTVDNPDNSSNYCTVGIENLLQSDGLLYTYANIYPATATELTANLSIKFTTDPPDNFVDIDDNELQITNYELKQNYPNPFQ